MTEPVPTAENTIDVGDSGLQRVCEIIFANDPRPTGSYCLIPEPNPDEPPLEDLEGLEREILIEFLDRCLITKFGRNLSQLINLDENQFDLAQRYLMSIGYQMCLSPTTRWYLHITRWEDPSAQVQVLDLDLSEGHDVYLKIARYLQTYPTRHFRISAPVFDDLEPDDPVDDFEMDFVQDIIKVLTGIACLDDLPNLPESKLIEVRHTMTRIGYDCQLVPKTGYQLKFNRLILRTSESTS